MTNRIKNFFENVVNIKLKESINKIIIKKR